MRQVASKAESKEDIEDLSKYATLVDRLRWLANDRPNVVATKFIPDGITLDSAMSYAELDGSARRFAAQLQKHNLSEERIVLMLPTGLDYLIAFFGCLYAGAIAITSYLPRPNRGLARLESIVNDAKPAAIIGHDDNLKTTELLEFLTTGSASPKLLSVKFMSKGDAAQWIKPDINRNSLAMLQYTSGSTSTPKGVMVSHGNVLNNCQMLIDALKPTKKTLGLSWLPLFHDMGLIGGALTPILVGFPIILMNFESFLMRPLRWLQAISNHRVNWSVGPNFAYDQCVKKVTAEQQEKLDLRSWQVALIGAETVRGSTLENFSQAFRNNGFSLEAFYPCYGLAEATLFVTGGARDTTPSFCQAGTSSTADSLSVSTKTALVSCGWPRLQEKVMVVDTVTGIPCPPGTVGEIWVTGPNIAIGYWQKPEATQTTFRAELVGDDHQYLRTGDLGFQLDNELYVTGRLKNMMIVAGRNIHLEDVEHTVISSQPESRLGGCAAFCVDQNLDQLLVLIVEIDRAEIKNIRQNKTADETLAFADELEKSISTAVVQQHDTAVHDIIFVRAGEISKTSSGKTQHHVCREKYLAGELVSTAFS